MRFAVLATTALLFACPALAAPQGDWPCVQRKVSEVSAAAIGAPPDLQLQGSQWRTDERIVKLVGEIAARRLPVAEAEQKILAFAGEGDAAKAELPLVFAGLLDRLNAERGDIIAGIERYGHKQKQLAERLREEMHAVDQARAKQETDPLKVAEANDRLVWDTRIFDERQKSLSYVCEVPVLIEQRLFALGRSILKAMQ